MRLSAAFHRWRPLSVYRRWAERERDEHGGWLVDEYGEVRFSLGRAQATLCECLCGLLLSLGAYVSIEGVFFSFHALEFVLQPLADDMVFVTNAEHGGTFLYTFMCFLPFTLNIATFKTVLMPLSIAPVYYIFVILFPLLHLLISYSSCIRILACQRNGDLTPAESLRQLLDAFLVEGAAWIAIQLFLLSDDRSPSPTAEEGALDARSALFALCLIPAVATVRFCMEPFATGLTLEESSEEDLPSKGGSIFGLVGLIVGGAYARTARLYLECTIIFGAVPYLWSLMNAGLTASWLLEVLYFGVPCLVIFYSILVSACIVRRMYANALTTRTTGRAGMVTATVVLGV